MAVPPKLIVYDSNDQYVEVDGLTDAITGAFVNNATMTSTLLDPLNQPVAGFTSIPMPYVPASNGVYRGFVTSVFDPSPSAGYTLLVDAVTPGGTKMHLEILTLVQPRRT